MAPKRVQFKSSKAPKTVQFKSSKPPKRVQFKSSKVPAKFRRRKNVRIKWIKAYDNRRKTKLLIAGEKAFKAETVPVLSYVQYISKSREIQIKEDSVPVPATSHFTRGHPGRFRWLRWCRKKQTIAEEEEFFLEDDKISLDSISTEEEEYQAKEQWPNKYISIMAYIALIFSTSNMMRFPYSCYRHGGSVFLMAYFLLSLLLIQPIIYLELILGQYSQSGVSGLSRFDIYSDGFTSVLSIMCLIFIPYNQIVVGYTGAYALESISSRAEDCNDSWNELDKCVSYKTVIIYDEQNNDEQQTDIWYDDGQIRVSLLSSELYYRQVILGERWDGSDYDRIPINFQLILGVIITYTFIFVVINKNLTSRFAQLTAWASILLPVLMVGILSHQLCWDGASNGILYFLEFKWVHMVSFDFWAEAILHAFISSGIGYGLYQRLAYRNPTTFHSFYSISWMICVLDFLFCTLSTLIVYSELGIIAHVFNMQDMMHIYAEKTAISFISYHGALMKFGYVWPVITFFALISLFGVWQQVVATQICTTYLTWWFPRKWRRKASTIRRRVILFVVVFLEGCWSIALLHMWPFILDAYVLFNGTWAAAFIILSEIFVVIYLYGINLLMVDIEIMMQFSVPNTYQKKLKYVMPAVTALAFVTLTINISLRPSTYYLETIQSPVWLTVVGVLLNLVPFIFLVMAGISAIRRRKEILEDNDVENGKPKQFELAFRRLRRSRPGVFSKSISKIDAHYFLQQEAACMKRRRRMQLNIKKRFLCLSRRKRVKAQWQRAVNKVLIRLGRVNTVPNLFQFAIRECDRQKNLKESDYLNQVVKKFSMENIFQSVEMADRGNPKAEYVQFLLGALASVPAKELPDYYTPLTARQLLKGERIPTKEEEKLKIVTRLKKNLGIPNRRDEDQLRKMIRTAKENAHENSCFREESPHEFYMEDFGKTIIRVIVIKGADHSLLRNLPRPKPPIMHIRESAIGGGTTARTIKKIKAAVEFDRKRKRLFKLPQKGLGDFVILAQTANQDSYDNAKTFLNRPTKFPHWYWGATSNQYAIQAADTHIVVLTNWYDDVRKHRFRWLRKRKFRKVWPNFTIVRRRYKGVKLINLAEFYKYQRKVAERERILSVPNDIIYHKDAGSPDTSGTPSLSPDTSSSDSYHYMHGDEYFKIPKPGLDILFRRKAPIKQLRHHRSKAAFPTNPPSAKPNKKMVSLHKANRTSVSPQVSPQYSSTTGEESSSPGPGTKMQREFFAKRRSRFMSVGARNVAQISGKASMHRGRSQTKGLSVTKQMEVDIEAAQGRIKRPALHNVKRDADLINTKVDAAKRKVEAGAQRKVDFPVKNTLSLQAVCSKTSARAYAVTFLGPGTSSRRRETRQVNSNDHPQFSYRPEGRTLHVENKKEAQKRFIWARPGDSISSIPDESTSNVISKLTVGFRTEPSSSEDSMLSVV